MAKVKRGGMLFGISGSLGNFVFSQMPDGSTRISVKPEYHRKGTQGQKDNRKRFKDRTAWAKEAWKVYPISAELAQDMPMVNAYNLALSDYAHPPVIHCLERKDGLIRVQASDNIYVASVHVWILDADGNELEHGEATRVDDEWWEYASPREGAVEVEVRDLPCNKTRQRL
jgi:hypothetical protein